MTELQGYPYLLTSSPCAPQTKYKTSHRYNTGTQSAIDVGHGSGFKGHFTRMGLKACLILDCRVLEVGSPRYKAFLVWTLSDFPT